MIKQNIKMSDSECKKELTIDEFKRSIGLIIFFQLLEVHDIHYQKHQLQLLEVSLKMEIQSNSRYRN